ncbi:MAG TPA: hypothetical protein VHX43_09100 [Xanthobacteraceae bacterium]|nr:hypothetical protein [Xanthobacteraceae bacterium]
MSRARPNHSSASAGAAAAEGPASFDTARIAEELGVEALDLAKRARDAGLTTLGFLLESAALEAGAQVAALQWPEDAPAR